MRPLGGLDWSPHSSQVPPRGVAAVTFRMDFGEVTRFRGGGSKSSLCPLCPQGPPGEVF